MNIRTLLRVVGQSPTIVELAGMARQAAEGDEEARKYLKEHGIFRALDVIRDGAGSAARGALKAYREVQPETIDCEFRVIEEHDSWERFIRWLKAQRWGTYAVIGPKGAGKTELAMRLAQVWKQQTGWAVESVNVYPESRYDFVECVPTRRFINRIHGIVELLNPPEPGEKQEPEEPGKHRPTTPEEIDRALEKYRRRIVVIDEMSLLVGSGGMDAGRAMVRQVMAQARHLSWLIIYIGQLCRMFPADLLNCEAVFVKQPTGREAIVDRDDALTQNLWTRAMEAFEEVRKEPRWADYPDMRAWSYVDSPSCGVHGYQGLMPASLAQAERMPDEEPEAGDETWATSAP